MNLIPWLLSCFLLCSPALSGVPIERNASGDLSDLIQQLESEDILVSTMAVKTLQQLDSTSIGELAQALESPLSPVIRARLELKLDALLIAILSEVDNLAVELSQLREIDSEKPIVEWLEESDDIRTRFTQLNEKLNSAGPFLAISLSGHAESSEVIDPFVERIRTRLRENIFENWSLSRAPQNQDSISAGELRWLAALSPHLAADDSDPFWKNIVEKAGVEATKDLTSFIPLRIERGRRYFLDMGDMGHDYLTRLSAEQQTLNIPENLLAEWRARNQIRLPANLDFNQTISLANWNALQGKEKLDLLLRLKAVHGDRINPTLVHVATVAADLRLRRRCAELLTLLGDSRGARIMLIDRRFGSDRLEEASRDAILRSAKNLMSTQDLAGARSLLEDLLARFPLDSEVRQTSGLIFLRLRQLPKAITEFIGCLELDPTNTTAHYNLACAYALSGDKDAAFNSLNNAFKNGYDRVDHVRNDLDLESLRSDPRFEELLKKI